MSIQYILSLFKSLSVSPGYIVQAYLTVCFTCFNVLEKPCPPKVYDYLPLHWIVDFMTIYIPSVLSFT